MTKNYQLCLRAVNIRFLYSAIEIFQLYLQINYLIELNKFKNCFTTSFELWIKIVEVKKYTLTYLTEVEEPHVLISFSDEY